MKCEYCNKDHDGSYCSGRFCSQHCSKGFSTKAKRKEINKKISLSLGGDGKLRSTTCHGCGKDISKLDNRKYCSSECFHLDKWNTYKNRIEKLQDFDYDKTQASRRIRRYLIEKYGNICSICGIKKWNDKPLIKIIDHIDGDAYNWKFNNIRLVCSNCDSQLDTYKSKNKNCTRKFNAHVKEKDK